MWRAAVLIVLLSHFASPEVTQQPASVGNAIIDKTLAVYRQCRTYRDEGKSTAIFSGQSGRQFKEEKSFRTAFVRPGQFRFEFESSLMTGKKYIVWRDGADVKTWWNRDNPPQGTPESLDVAIRAASFMSLGLAYYVPSLLLPSEVEGFALAHLKDMTQIEDDTIGGRSFYRFQCPPRQSPSLDAKTVETVWIDKQTFLVRRIFVEIQGTDSPAQVTTDYDATIDAPIPMEQLAFAHP